MSLKKNKNYLFRYISVAPLPLAFERVLECRIYSQIEFKKPVLDLGCGDGIFSKILFKEKVDTGVDPNQRELNHAEKEGMYHELIMADGGSIPKPDDYFKTIYSNSVLEHIQDIEAVLNEVYRVLAKGGRFYMTVPKDIYEQYTMVYQILKKLSFDKTAEKFANYYNRFWKHFHCYSSSEWERMVKKAGFKVLKSQSYNPEYLCKLNDFLVPFSFPAFLSKKLINRWILFPFIRKVFVFPIFQIAKKVLKNCEENDRGGLLFMELGKLA